MRNRRAMPHPVDFRLGFALVLLWTALAGTLFAARQEDAAAESRLADISSQAQAAQQKGDYRTAADRYQEIVKLRPDVAEAWANLGLMHQFLGEYPQADHNFQVALSKNPRLYVPNLFLGLNQLRMRQPAEALRFLKIAENLNPGDEQTAMGMARAYQASHDNAAASKWFSRATKINSADPEAWYGLGTAYLSLQDGAAIQLAKLGQNGPYARSLVADSFVVQGRIKDAIIIYNKLLADPAQPPCLLPSLGFAYVQQDPDLAHRTFERALRTVPGCLTTQVGLARLALAKGDFAEMLQQMKAAWDADRNFSATNVQRIWQGADPDQIGKAAAWLRQSSPQDSATQLLIHSIESAGSPSRESSESKEQATGSSSDSYGNGALSPETLWEQGHYTACESALQRGKQAASLKRALLLAQCSFYAGDYEASLAASGKALKIDAQSSAALYWQAKSSQELAADALQQMSLAAPDSAKVHLLLAELHRAREEFEAAEAEYTQVLDSGANDPAARLGLAEVYYHESQDDKALQQLLVVLKDDPTNPQASLLMGQILTRRHQYAEAIPYLKVALNGPSLSPSQVHSLLARCLMAQGDFSGALVELKPAVPSDTTGTIHYQLYQIYKKLGDEKAAAGAFQESERLRREESQAEQQQREMEGAGSPR